MSESSLFHGNMVNSRRVIYTPSLFARSSLLYLQETGTLRAREPHTSSRAHLPSYLCFLVLRGAGRLDYQKHSYRLRAGDCVFIDCRSGYAHTTAEDLWELQWVHFDGSAMPGIYEKYLERGGSAVFHPEDAGAFSSCLDSLYRCASGQDYLRDMHINQHLSALLTILMENSWNPEQAGDRALRQGNLLQIRQYIDEHYSEALSLESIAERFFMSKQYLARIFRQQYGISVGTCIRQARISKAKELLRFTDMPVSEIGEVVGISDSNYFSRYFLKTEGCSPTEYRRRW